MPCQSERLLISPCFGRIEPVKDLSFMLGIKSITLNGDQNHIFIISPNGQLISKCLFGVFTFFQETNENKSTSSEVEFVRSFFGRNFGLKNFEFV